MRDVWSRLPALKAAVTSTFGEILKVDSTKKVCRKLQGASVNMVAWATNVGNERPDFRADRVRKCNWTATYGEWPCQPLPQIRQASSTCPVHRP